MSISRRLFGGAALAALMVAGGTAQAQDDVRIALVVKALGIGFNETTADGCFTLKEGECMGACGDAPVLLVNNHRMCSFMSNEKLDQLIKELKS